MSWLSLPLFQQVCWKWFAFPTNQSRFYLLVMRKYCQKMAEVSFSQTAFSCFSLASCCTANELKIVPSFQALWKISFGKWTPHFWFSISASSSRRSSKSLARIRLNLEWSGVKSKWIGPPTKSWSPDKLVGEDRWARTERLMSGDSRWPNLWERIERGRGSSSSSPFKSVTRFFTVSVVSGVLWSGGGFKGGSEGEFKAWVRLRIGVLKSSSPNCVRIGFGGLNWVVSSNLRFLLRFGNTPVGDPKPFSTGDDGGATCLLGVSGETRSTTSALSLASRDNLGAMAKSILIIFSPTQAWIRIAAWKGYGARPQQELRKTFLTELLVSV